MPLFVACQVGLDAGWRRERGREWGAGRGGRRGGWAKNMRGGRSDSDVTGRYHQDDYGVCRRPAENHVYAQLARGIHDNNSVGNHMI
jgi:hypothetical protein